MGRSLHLKPADARQVPWRNGRGVTSEIAIWPEGASFAEGDFDWRISLAGVAEDGPFSVFDGFVRSLVLIEGTGLSIDHGSDGGRTELSWPVPHAFDGGWNTSARLVDGPVRDLGVIARKDRWTIELMAIDLASAGARLHLDAIDHGLLHVLSGTVAVGPAGGRPAAQRIELAQRLEPGESLWYRPATEALELDVYAAGGIARAVFARLMPHAD